MGQGVRLLLGAGRKDESGDFTKGAGLSLADIEQVLGESFAACVPNQYGLVREAIDRGVPIDEVKPGNRITATLKKLVVPAAAQKGAAAAAGGSLNKVKLS